jgi:hypothetical protein
MSLYELANKVDTCIVDWGTNYTDWYCGVTSDPERHLFGDHNVNKGAGFWILVDAGSDLAALHLKTCFLQKGCQGVAGGGNAEARFFYAYLIMPSTRQ